MKNSATTTARIASTAALVSTAGIALLAGTGAAQADPGTFTNADLHYLKAMSEQRGTLAGTDRDLVELGVATCGALRTSPVQTVVDTGIDAGIGGYDVGVLIGAASWNYCPDTWPAVRAWAAAV